MSCCTYLSAVSAVRSGRHRCVLLQPHAPSSYRACPKKRPRPLALPCETKLPSVGVFLDPLSGCLTRNNRQQRIVHPQTAVVCPPTPTNNVLSVCIHRYTPRAFSLQEQKSGDAFPWHGGDGALFRQR